MGDVILSSRSDQQLVDTDEQKVNVKMSEEPISAHVEKKRSSTPTGVRIIENEFIYLKDAIRLSARIWLPSDATENPVPAILEMLPYRKRDITCARDEITYAHFAQHGYAGVRVDMRGCGDSTGIIQDEYVEREQEDALQVIDWIVAQPWCSGNVGMMGISWGGFNSLQLAYEEPEALKAIISICFTDDRYSDDIHYKGGVMLMDNLKWGASMEIRYSLPPDPLLSEDWRDVWLTRMKSTPPLLERWLSHPTRDKYWKHGSICEDYTRIKAASFLIGGYADGYTNPVERTLRNINCSKRAIIGPWVHLYPHIAKPEPLWGFCTEAVKWWDKHLKGVEMPEEPELISYIQDGVDVPCPTEVPGRWVCDHKSEMETYYLKDNKLGDEVGEGCVDICSKETCGQCAGIFFPVKLYEMPLEQTPDDELSYCFETDCFIEPFEILGKPMVHLSVASDKAIANIFVRLCLVNPSGESRLIAYNAHNLNHDETHEKVTKMVPGVFKDIQVQLDYIGEKINTGYKLRLCLSTAYFPLFLPNPEHTTVTVDLQKCKFEIPVLKSWNELPYDVPPITECKPKAVKIKKPPKVRRTFEVDENGKATVTVRTHSGKKTFVSHGLTTEWKTEQVESILPDDPTSAELYIKHEVTWERGGDWKCEVLYDVKFTCDKDYFYTFENRVAKHNEDTIFSKMYETNILRVAV